MGSLAIASRIKSLSAEVFQTLPTSPDEKWSMLSPNSSQCFREFENMASLENLKLTNNRGRMSGKNLKGNLFDELNQIIEEMRDETINAQIEAIRELSPEIAIIEQVCKGLKSESSY